MALFFFFNLFALKSDPTFSSIFLHSKVTQLFLQSFCTKNWPNFFFNLFALKSDLFFFCNLFALKNYPKSDPIFFQCFYSKMVSKVLLQCFHTKMHLWWNLQFLQCSYTEMVSQICVNVSTLKWWFQIYFNVYALKW